MAAVTAAFVAKNQRIDRVRTSRVQCALAAEFGVQLRGAPPTGADPSDPAHGECVESLLNLKEALVRLLQSHLSYRSIEDLDSLFDFWSSGAVLDAFFTSEELQDERAQIMAALQGGDADG